MNGSTAPVVPAYHPQLHEQTGQQDTGAAGLQSIAQATGASSSRQRRGSSHSRSMQLADCEDIGPSRNSSAQQGSRRQHPAQGHRHAGRSSCQPDSNRHQSVQAADASHTASEGGPVRSLPWPGAQPEDGSSRGAASTRGRGRVSRGRRQANFVHHRRTAAGGGTHSGHKEVGTLEAPHMKVQEAVPAPTSFQHPSNSHAKPSEDAPLCVVCHEPLQVVALGSCNHKSMCGDCCLRLRLCYQDTNCPLCKTKQDEVVITRWRSSGLPDFSWYDGHRGELWQKQRWARGILVDNWLPHGAARAKPLHVALQQRTAIACPVCDKGGRKPMQSVKQLQQHVAAAHDRRLCHVCLQAGRVFPLNLEAYTAEALQEHLASHPHCAFCSLHFYSGDDAYDHNQREHFSCDVCLREHGSFLYFRDATSLVQHLRTEHHLCEEGPCAGCFTAFASLDGLRQHTLERHAQRMPRWQAGQARRLELAVPTYQQQRAAEMGRLRRQRDVPRPHVGNADADVARGGGQGRGERGRGRGMPGEVLIRDLPNGSVPVSGRGTGMTMIDDDLGMSSEAFPEMPGAASSAAVSAQRQQEAPQQAEAFPTLAAIAARPPPRPASPDAQRSQRRLAPLVPVAVRCPCGRRSARQVLQQGQAPAPLPCDAECARQQRASRLADAFGVEDAAHHLSYFDRHRTPAYSAAQLQAAHADPAFITSLERSLALFLADKAAKRQPLAPMPEAQRRLVHELAHQYGLATHAYKPEPHRYVELFKTETASVPLKLLSETAARMSAEEVAQLAAGCEGHPLRLTDVAAGLDVSQYLRPWEGDYTLELDRAAGDAVLVRFGRAQDLAAALDVLGGGIRGRFRVDRASAAAGRQPGEAGSAQPTPAAAPAASRRSQPPPAATVGQGAAEQSEDGWQVARPKARTQAQEAAPTAADYADPWASSGDEGGDQDEKEGDLPEDWEDAAVSVSEPDLAANTAGGTVRKGSPISAQANEWNVLGDGDE